MLIFPRVIETVSCFADVVKRKCIFVEEFEEFGGTVIPATHAEETHQDAQANLAGATCLTSFTPLAVVRNQTLMLP